MKTKFFGLVAVCLLLIGQGAFARVFGPSGYHEIKKISIGGEGGWDYLIVDSAGRRLYVSHGTKVVVIDIDKDTVVGEIPNTNGVHGIAIADDLGRGFTSDGRDAKVTIFDLKTLKVLGTAPTGQNPDAIIYDPSSKRVFTFNGRSNDVTAIDGATGEVAGTIKVPGKPEFATSNQKDRIFVNIEDKSEILAIDPKKLSVEATWPLAPCEEPSGMGIDVKNQRLFSGCHNKMMAVVDATNGKVIATPAIGSGVDANNFDPGTGYAFASNGDGTLTVVHEDSPSKFSVVENVATHAGARTMALDTKTHNVYLAMAEYGPTPPPDANGRRQRPQAIKDSFAILVFGK